MENKGQKDERALRAEALAHVAKGWLEGPYQFNEEGSLVTAGGPQSANPSFRFGVQQGEKLRAIGDIKRSQTTGQPSYVGPFRGCHKVFPGTWRRQIIWKAGSGEGRSY